MLKIFIIFSLLSYSSYNYSESCQNKCLAPISNDNSKEELINLSIIRSIGYLNHDDEIINSYFDSYGYLIIEKKLKNGNNLKITFENDTPFSIDGEIEDLIYYLENDLKYSNNDFNDITLFKVKENLRYFVFKRLVKYRFLAKSYLHKLSQYKDESVEPSSIVRAEVDVALRMIGDDLGTIEPGGKRLNISFLSYEAAPLIKKGGLSDVAGTLPRVLQNKRGHNVSVIIPFWSEIQNEISKNAELKIEKTGIDSFQIDGYFFEIFKVIIDNTPIFLLKNDDFFKVEKDFDISKQDKIRNDIYRKDLDIAYGTSLKEKMQRGEISHDDYGRSKYQIHPENAKRAFYFSRASVRALELISNKDNLKPDIINTADWQTGLVPALIKNIKNTESSSIFNNVKVVHTIHNLSFKGLFDPTFWYFTSLPWEYYIPPDLQGAEFWGNASLMKLGIVCADKVTTVSQPYAEEIQTREFGDGFDGIFKLSKPTGIINGISRRNLSFKVNRWIQRADLSPTNYEKQLGVLDLIEGKEINKKLLRSKYGLKEYQGERIPIISYAARFSEQKGLNYLMPAIREILASGQRVQFIFAGEGDKKYEDEMKSLMHEFPGDFVWTGKFEPEKEVIRVLAGSDILAMPSLFEPCGITQLQAMRYGTIPLVNPVGGLIATVYDFLREKNNNSKKGNGYVINRGNENILTIRNILETLKIAVNDFNNQDIWNEQVKQTFERSKDFSWENSALEYENMFYDLLGFIPFKSDFYKNNRQKFLNAA